MSLLKSSIQTFRTSNTTSLGEDDVFVQTPIVNGKRRFGLISQGEYYKIYGDSQRNTKQKFFLDIEKGDDVQIGDDVRGTFDLSGLTFYGKVKIIQPATVAKMGFVAKALGEVNN